MVHAREFYLQKAKQKLLASFAVNSNGSYILLVRSIESAGVFTCFRLYTNARKFVRHKITLRWMVTSSDCSYCG